MALSRQRIDDEEARRRLGELSGWQLEGGRLRKQFEFDDFVRAFGFMASCALEAEKLAHHPDWKNVYNRVDIELWTHDAGGLTDYDFALAAAMDRVAGG